MNSNTNYPLLGQILGDRYQIVSVLSSGAFGQTYTARDLQVTHQPERAVKHYALDLDYPSLVVASKRLFRSEVESLRRLGIHSQIPRLIDSFETEQDLYLIQELIVGPTLGNYLSSLKERNLAARETETIALLRDVLNVLDFIHRQGTLHGDLKPNNLMRRDRDRAWIVIDFGTAQPFSLYSNPNGSRLSLNHRAIASPLGYLAPEQSRGISSASSDIYALGIIALEMLAGFNPFDPKDFQRYPPTGTLTWFETKATEISEYNGTLLAILKKMVRYDAQQRYQSAAEVLQALSKIEPVALPVAQPLCEPEEDLSQGILIATSKDRNGSAGPSVRALAKSPSSRKAPKRKLGRRPQLSPLMGIWVVIATLNTLAIASSWQTLNDPAIAEAGASSLWRASRIYHEGKFVDAIALAQSVSPESPAYRESRNLIQQWTQDWRQAEQLFQDIKQLFNHQQWDAVLAQTQQMPQNKFWQQRLQPLIRQAQIQASAEAQAYFSQALNRAERQDFTGALYYLEKISPHTPLGAKVRLKLFEYRHKQRIRATATLQQAYNHAARRDFSGAIYYLEKIPPQTPAGAIAQRKKIEYAQKQRIKAQVETSARSSTQAHLNPGRHLQEINSPAATRFLFS